MRSLNIGSQFALTAGLTYLFHNGALTTGVGTAAAVGMPLLPALVMASVTMLVFNAVLEMTAPTYSLLPRRSLFDNWFNWGTQPAVGHVHVMHQQPYYQPPVQQVHHIHHQQPVQPPSIFVTPPTVTHTLVPALPPQQPVEPLIIHRPAGYPALQLLKTAKANEINAVVKRHQAQQQAQQQSLLGTPLAPAPAPAGERRVVKHALVPASAPPSQQPQQPIPGGGPTVVARNFVPLFNQQNNQQHTNPAATPSAPVVGGGPAVVNRVIVPAQPPAAPAAPVVGGGPVVVDRKIVSVMKR